jgi:hypothetical protein
MAISTDGSVYTDDEFEFLNAVEEFRKRTAVRFPKLTDYLRIAKGLGYRKTSNESVFNDGKCGDVKAS